MQEREQVFLLLRRQADRESRVVEVDHVLQRRRGAVVEIAEALTDAHLGSASNVPTLQEAERAAIYKALQTTGWRIGGSKGAALLLDINPSTLRSRMTQLGIRRPLT